MNFSLPIPLRPKEAAPPWQPVAMWLWYCFLGAVDKKDQGHPVTSGHPEVCESFRAPKKEPLQSPRWQTGLHSLIPRRPYCVSQKLRCWIFTWKRFYSFICMAGIWEIKHKFTLQSCNAVNTFPCRIVSSSFYTYWYIKIKNPVSTFKNFDLSTISTEGYVCSFNL